MQNKYVSEAVIRRLPKYYRKLQELSQKGVESISSQALSEEMDLNASQIRRDFNCFGGFGQQGYGYQVERLKNKLGEILGLDKQYNVIIIGAGNIGRALAGYSGFKAQRFNILGIFDTDKDSIGTKINGIDVYDADNISSFIKQNNISMAFICTPASSAQKVCDILVENNIKGIWNFAPADLNCPDSVSLENVHLSDSLFVLTYRINNN